MATSPQDSVTHFSVPTAFVYGANVVASAQSNKILEAELKRFINNNLKTGPNKPLCITQSYTNADGDYHYLEITNLVRIPPTITSQLQSKFNSVCTSTVDTINVGKLTLTIETPSRPIPIPASRIRSYTPFSDLLKLFLLFTIIILCWTCQYQHAMPWPWLRK